jgi:hypothetical protein
MLLNLRSLVVLREGNVIKLNLIVSREDTKAQSSELFSSRLRVSARTKFRKNIVRNLLA